MPAEVGTVKTNTFSLAIAFLIASALLLTGCARPSETGTVEIGRPAPPFKLPDLNGREISLSQFKGKVVMLDFWATWCGPCRMTMPLLEKLQKEYPSNMVLLAINLQETPGAVREYMREQNVNSQVLLDEQGSVGEAYGSAQIPMQVLVDKAGIVRFIQIGFDPRMTARLRGEIEKLR